MRIGLYGRNLKEQDVPFFCELLEAFTEKECTVIFHEKFFKSVNEFISLPLDYPQFSSTDILKNTIDVLFTFGGDGTLLDTVLLIRDSNIPVMGINTGRLGFLTTISRDDIYNAISAIEKGDYDIEERTLLEYSGNQALFGKHNIALNEFSIHRNDVSTMITVHTYIDGEFLNSYWADGLIIATPTGSTGYSLSCGGPIVTPQSDNFIITPVSPHNLTMRPLVIADKHTLTFEVEGRSDDFLCTLDSRYAHFKPGTRHQVKKADFKIKLIRFKDYSFMATIREKLMWGADKRN